jgi:hypothetical protein
VVVPLGASPRGIEPGRDLPKLINELCTGSVLQGIILKELPWDACSMLA